MRKFSCRARLGRTQRQSVPRVVYIPRDDSARLVRRRWPTSRRTNGQPTCIRSAVDPSQIEGRSMWHILAKEKSPRGRMPPAQVMSGTETGACFLSLHDEAHTSTAVDSPGSHSVAPPRPAGPAVRIIFCASCAGAPKNSCEGFDHAFLYNSISHQAVAARYATPVVTLMCFPAPCCG